MRAADAFEIIAVAAGGALVVGLLGLTVAWLTRSWSLRWHLGVVAVVSALGSYVGAVAIARLMFLSSHDLQVMTLVSSAGLVVAIAASVLLGVAVTMWSSVLRAEVRVLAEGGPNPAPHAGPREIRGLSEELALTRRRLEEARERELRLENSRRELVSWVSHDLRTPLAGLRAMAEALEDGMVEEPARYHRRIRSEVDRMASMVDDLFELSRIHAGVLTLAPEAVALGDLVSEAIAGADPLARARSIRVGGRVEDGLEVTADPAGLSRVMANLLMNAIRHTPAEGAVEINGRLVPGGIELSVSDGCGGIDPAEIDRVFDLAWQGSSARTPGDVALGQGAGLGLAIVKGIVEAHRGLVRVENLTDDSGCRFLVTLPA